MENKKLGSNLILLFFLVLCLRCASLAPKSILDTNSETNQTILGTWERVNKQDADSAGNILTDVPKFELDVFGEGDKEVSERKVRINFTSSGEAYSFTNGVRDGLGFNYSVNDSVIVLGNRGYILLNINDTTFRMLDALDGMLSFTGAYDLTTWRRISKDQVPGTRLKLKESILGEWQVHYTQHVETKGNALFNEREKVSGFISVKKLNDVRFKFERNRFEMGQKLGAFFDYDIADSVIYTSGNPMFTILKLTEDSLSLLGVHGTVEQLGEPISVWKMYKVKGN